jgi:hypothetical protein
MESPRDERLVTRTVRREWSRRDPEDRFGERALGRFPDIERAGDGREDEWRIGDGGQGGEDGAIGEVVGTCMRRGNGQPGLAAAGPDQGDQAGFIATQPVGEPGDIMLATNEWRQRLGKARP